MEKVILRLNLKLTTRVIIIILILISEHIIAQQKVQFTQYMFNNLVINPAYAGADEALSLTFIQRSQWSGVDKSPTTQTLSGHTLFKQKQIGLGLTIINDKIGVHKNLSALTNYAYHLKTGSSSYLSMGIQAGIHNKKADYASLAGISNNDPKLSNSIISHTFFDFGMGIYFRSPAWHIGISAPELIPETISINDTSSIRLSYVNYFLFSKYKIKLSENMDFEPGVLIKYLAGVPLSYDINMNLIFAEVLTTGFSYRKSESVDFLLKGQITPQLQFGYSYDHPVGIIARISNGSHEIMINYLFRYTKSNVTSPR